MRKFSKIFIGSLFTLWLVGCNQGSNPGGNIVYVSSVQIDSALTACGQDSFLIHSPWMQERINPFIDTMQQNSHNPVGHLIFEHCVDSANNDYFLEHWPSGSSVGYLYDCEGILLDTWSPWYSVPKEKGLIINNTAVDIEIGSHYFI